MNPTLALLIAAIIQVESGGNNAAKGRHGELGCLQITPAVVADVNRIQGAANFTLADRLSHDRSVTMFRVYSDHYATEDRLNREPSIEDIARIWHAGPTRHRSPHALKYWRKVRAAMEASK